VRKNDGKDVHGGGGRWRVEEDGGERRTIFFFETPSKHNYDKGSTTPRH